MGSPSASYDSTMDCCDVANSKQFMEALINFLNEASICMKEVRQRTGIPDDGTPVQMNEEEKVDRMSLILCGLNQKYQMEKRKTGTGIQTPSAFAMERAYSHPGYPSNQEINKKRRMEYGRRPPSSTGGRELIYEPNKMAKTPEQIQMILMQKYGPQEMCHESGMMGKTPGQLQRRLVQEYVQPGQEIRFDPGIRGKPLGQECPSAQEICYEPGNAPSAGRSLQESCPPSQEMCYEPGMIGGRNLEAKPRVPRSFIEDCSTECKNVVRSGGKTW